MNKSLTDQARARIEKLEGWAGKTASLVFTISYDLKNGESGEYAQIIKALGELGYTRDSSVGEDTLPKNFYAGEKAITYSPGGKPSLQEAIEKESLDFKKKVQNVMKEKANGKLNKLFMSVSLKDTTVIFVNPK